jgi:hypothetical protein
MYVIVACTFLVLMRIDSSMARNASSNNTSLLPLLDDSSYNITHQLEKKADFLYTAVQEYIRDAEEDNKPELIILWKKMKEDEQNHLKMLKKELVGQVRQSRLDRLENSMRTMRMPRVDSLGGDTISNV